MSNCGKPLKSIKCYLKKLIDEVSTTVSPSKDECIHQGNVLGYGKNVEANRAIRSQASSFL